MPRHPNPDMRVNVLFLQGPPSAFARVLGAELTARGAGVHRINLCIGDWIFWHDEHAQSYRGSLKNWADYLREFIHTNQITDIVYFADRFPYHVVAQQVARDLGIRAISYEYGYLRPDWIITEPGGQSAYSHFPTDIKVIRKAAKPLPQPDLKQQFASDFQSEANGDVIYHLSNYLLWFLYPKFCRDRVYNPVIEYLSYIPRNRRARKNLANAAELVARLAAGTKPYFVVPLQMQNDYQIRKNSAYDNQRGFLDEVLVSFQEHAPQDALLVVKVHPLDNGLENWSRHLRRKAGSLGITDRVHYLDGGDLGRLTNGAQGTITINSTSGVAALKSGCALKVMGVSVFDIAGLTHQGSLDTFWTGAQKPIETNVGDFIKVMAAYCHVRGNFYGNEGRAAAVQSFCDRLISGTFPFDIFEQHPPRLDKARHMGIDVEYPATATNPADQSILTTPIQEAENAQSA